MSTSLQYYYYTHIFKLDIGTFSVLCDNSYVSINNIRCNIRIVLSLMAPTVLMALWIEVGFFLPQLCPNLYLYTILRPTCAYTHKQIKQQILLKRFFTYTQT